MRIRKCCVLGCNNQRKDAFLHYFPISDETGLNKWLDCINSEHLKTFSKEKLGQLAVCHIHFEKRFITQSLRLRYGAYPFLFTTEEISSGLPKVPIEDIPNKYEQPSMKRHSDHTYFKSDEPTPKHARYNASVSANPCSEFAQDLQSESTLIIQPSTSFQAAAPISACSEFAQNLKDSTPIIQPSTSFQTEGASFTVPKTPKASRKRLATKLNNLTPRCATIYKEYSKAKKQVVDIETRKPLGPNASGEICAKGLLLMKGYVGKDRGDDFDDEGFYKTGDIGYYDNEGYFYIVDRLKELIKYKGYQVPPAELEAVLLQHPSIKDGAVIGIEDKIAGEVPLAFVVTQPGKQLSEKEVQDFVAERLSNPKHLRGGVRFVDQIPKSASGKILRKDLRKLVAPVKSRL